VIVPLTLVQQRLSPTLVKVYMLNPLATIFQQFRHAAINHATPSAGAILGTGGVLAVVAIVFAMFALGFVVFNRTAPYVAENL
jgi:ABC-type polysaccharide/polyol phosphate export permease